MRFFDQPILNSPYEYPSQHWELDEHGQPTNRSIQERRSVAFITPIPQPRKHKQTQREIVFDQASREIETESQQYNLAHVVNDLRRRVDSWRRLPNPSQWRVTPGTNEAWRLTNNQPRRRSRYIVKGTFFMVRIERFFFAMAV